MTNSPPPSPDALKALGRVPSGLFIATAGSGETAVATLVSFVQQLSFDPPCIGLALRPDRALAAAIAREKFFVLNILHAGDKSLLRHFAKASLTGPAAFASVPCNPVPRGGAILLDACAYLECQLLSTVTFDADHTLFIARLTAGNLLLDPATKPTVHLRHDGARY